MSLGLLVALVACVAVMRGLGWGGEAVPAVVHRSPVERALLWFEGHEYAVLSQVDGGRTLNASAVHRGTSVRGDLQTMTAGGGRQLGYTQFRLGAGQELSTASGATASVWSSATPTQRSVLADLVQPRRVLDRLGPADQLVDAGQAGDAEVYRSRNGSSLYLIGDRPARVVIHARRGHQTQVFQYTALEEAR